MQRNLPQISVVTVVWNNLDGLRTTAASISEQTYAKIEHVVVDGASSDGTQTWLSQYRPSYPSKLVSEPDDGLYQAMNKGLGMSKGDLVIFLNGGDTFSQDDVLNFVADQWAEGSWSWGYGGINYIDADRNILRQFDLNPFDARRVQLGRTYVPHPATFMSRELLLELGGFRPEFGWSADQELGVRAALRSTPAVWARTMTDFLVGGAHSQGSLWDVSRRYSRIRRANGVPVLGRPLFDRAYTESLGAYWTLRNWLSKRLKQTGGVDSIRKK